MTKRMAMDKPLYQGGICLITDRNLCCLTPAEMAEMALQSGIRWIQYRDKHKDRRSYLANAMQIRLITKRYGACFIINDFPDIAAIVDADGVHLGQDDMPIGEARKIVGQKRIIGISTHSLKEAVKADEEGADYIGFGPIYPTRTKAAAGEPQGTEELRKIAHKVKIPVVAIGGIRISRLSDVMASGACAVAAASAILKGDMKLNAHKYCGRLGKIAARAGLV